MTMTAADVKKRLKENEEKSRGSKTPYLKVEPKEYIIRVGPPIRKEGEVWADVLFHNYGGKDYREAKVYCANNDTDKETGKTRKCKVEQRIKEINEDRTPYSKKLWGLIHQRNEALWNVLVVKKYKKIGKKIIARSYVDNQFKVLQLASKWQNMMLDIFAESEYREGKAGILGVAHPKYGYFIRMTRRGTEENTEYSFRVIGEACPIFKDQEKRKEILATLIDLDKMVRGSSDEELSAWLHRAEKKAKKLINEDKEEKDEDENEKEEDEEDEEETDEDEEEVDKKKKKKSSDEEDEDEEGDGEDEDDDEDEDEEDEEDDEDEEDEDEEEEEDEDDEEEGDLEKQYKKAKKAVEKKKKKSDDDEDEEEEEEEDED